jgi:phage terminase large subunit-like protein
MTAAYLRQPDGTPHTSASFDLAAYMASIDELYQGRLDDLLKTDFGRQEITKFDPLMYAIVYLPDTLTEGIGTITFADAHLEFCRDALTWTGPVTEMKEHRTAYVEPRNLGKSSWLYLILPMWAASHGHKKFIAAFADSSGQAEEHLSTFRNELQNNDLLKTDYPELCTPMRRSRGNVESDSKGDYKAKSGFIFKARGIGSSLLGMKVGNLRPDLIVGDDLEPKEGDYSPAMAATRLGDLLDGVLPLNAHATVVLTGTVNMSGSIMDDLARSTEGGESEKWITASNFKVKYHHAIINDNGNDRSLWPGKWSLEELYKERSEDPRGYAKNFNNAPMSSDSGYWEPSYFRLGTLDSPSFTILSVDPAVSKKSTSDWTGFSIVRYSRTEDLFQVAYAAQVRMNGRELRARVLSLLEQFPDIGTVLVETNQGGDTLWVDEDGVFYDLPVKVITVHQRLSKELRAEKAVLEFSRQKVVFAHRFPDLERQLLAFPKVAHDDMVDACVSAIIDIRSRVKVDVRRRGPRVRQSHYARR